MTTGTAPSSSSGAPRIPADRLAAWRAFLEAHARVTEVLARELRDEVQLPLAWYDVLVHLQESDDNRLRMQELADAVLLSKSGLTRLVDRMESEGLVRRAACTDDRRGTFAELTPQGFELLRSTTPTHLRGVDAHFTSLLDDDEVEVLTSALRRVAEGATATDD